MEKEVIKSDSPFSVLGDWVGGSDTHQDWRDWRMGWCRRRFEGDDCELFGSRHVEFEVLVGYSGEIIQQRIRK